jgi:hypothetical protein
MTISVNLIGILGNAEIAFLTDRKRRDARVTGHLPVATSSIAAKSDPASRSELLDPILRLLF